MAAGFFTGAGAVMVAVWGGIFSFVAAAIVACAVLVIGAAVAAGWVRLADACAASGFVAVIAVFLW